MTVLKHQAATITAERDELLQQLTKPALDNPSNQHADDEENAKLRLQIKHLEQRLDEAKAADMRHQEELQRCEAQLAEAAEAKNSLRAEQLKLAEERASVSRLRAEIAAEQAERRPRPQGAAGDIDDRVREFRQHLREIHEEEKQQTHEPRSLTSRIAQLWNRVEGHR